MNILLLSSSLNDLSRSRALAHLAAEDLTALGIEHRFIDLRDYNLPMCDGGSTFAQAPVAEMRQAVLDASAIILATPIYNYDVNAAAKNFLELTGKAWRDKVVGFLCAAGGASSYMSVMGLANSLMLDFRCVIVPRFVYAPGSAFDRTPENRNILMSEEMHARVTELVTTTARLAAAVEAAAAEAHSAGGGPGA